MIGFARTEPSAPNNLNLTQDLVNKELVITWSNTAGVATDGFVIKRQKIDGSETTYFTVDGQNNTAYTDGGIELCQTYRYTVGAYNECHPDYATGDATFSNTDVTGNISQDLSNVISSLDASIAYYPDRVRLEWDVFGSFSQVDRF